MVFIEGMIFIECINNMVLIEGCHQRQVIVSIHGANLTHKIESQNMKGVEDDTHDATILITQNSCLNLIQYLKASNENDFSIVFNRR